MDLNGKCVVITGVSRGIGNALVHQFLAKGCLVGGMGLNDPKIAHQNFSFIRRIYVRVKMCEYLLTLI